MHPDNHSVAAAANPSYAKGYGGQRPAYAKSYGEAKKEKERDEKAGKHDQKHCGSLCCY